MSIDDRWADSAGPRPRAELIAAGLSPTIGAATDDSSTFSDAVIKELWAIDEQVSAIQHMQHDNTVDVDELLAHCLMTWLRIKSLRQSLDVDSH